MSSYQMIDFANDQKILITLHIIRPFIDEDDRKYV